MTRAEWARRYREARLTAHLLRAAEHEIIQRTHDMMRRAMLYGTAVMSVEWRG